MPFVCCHLNSRAFKKSSIWSRFYADKEYHLIKQNVPSSVIWRTTFLVRSQTGCSVFCRSRRSGGSGLGHRLTQYSGFQRFVGLLNMYILPTCLCLPKCENQPVTGAPQPLQTTPQRFRIRPENSPKRKHSFELTAKAETWSSKLLLNLNHKDQILSSISNTFSLFHYYTFFHGKI